MSFSEEELDSLFTQLHKELKNDVVMSFNSLSGRVYEQLEASIPDHKQRDALKRIIKNIMWGSATDLTKNENCTLEQFSSLFGVKSKMLSKMETLYRKINFNKVVEDDGKEKENS